MDYHRIVEMVPSGKREKLSTKLIDLILKSKNADKMPSSLARALLHQWQRSPLTNEIGITTLLEAAVILESEKTIEALEEKLQLPDVAKAIRAVE
ncbi:MAG: hypothetical protein OEZ29_08630 [Candidatus Bathyarchaeota archaeon]|nr:hypothetical protein [Candidatus Bathyarchaeota archaeon]MDH5780642.1 hypothetical protein [Candidatus Bathyarchaeota archaeon]